MVRETARFVQHDGRLLKKNPWLLRRFSTPEAVLCGLKANGKKQLLQELAASACASVRSPRAIISRHRCSGSVLAQPASGRASPFRMAVLRA